MFRKVAVLAVCLAVLAPAALAQDRVTATEKGSVLVWPKIELRFDSSMNLIQDTFVTINNDFNGSVDIQLYFVSEICTTVDNTITLTKNEPAYWSSYSGLPKGVSPFTVLGDPYPDPENPNQYILRGYVIGWAINSDYEQINWNHLYGGATIVNYEDGGAWEYNAYTFQALQGANGQNVGLPGVINLDGTEFDWGFQNLLLDFFAWDSEAFSSDDRQVRVGTDLTLVIMDIDVTQDAPAPPITKAKFDIWNENEIGRSGFEYCVTKWNQRLLNYSHFTLQNLGTDKGRARITGMASSVCDFEDPEGNTIESVDTSLLGVAAKILNFDDGAEYGYAGTNLFGAGTRAATIRYDVLDAPPTLNTLAPVGTTPVRGLAR